MKTMLRALALFLLSTTCWVGSLNADQISVTYAFGGPNSVDASLSGVSLGPAVNLDVSDQQTGQIFTLGGLSASSTGRATSFTVLTSPNLVLANYSAGGANSVLVLDSMGNILIAGTMESRGSAVSTYPNGTGAFLGDFLVSEVSPGLLGLFGKGPGFLPDGSVSATFGEANLVGTDHLVAAVGGGSITIQTPTPVAEPAAMILYGTGLFICMIGVRRFNRSQKKLSGKDPLLIDPMIS